MVMIIIEMYVSNLFEHLNMRNVTGRYETEYMAAFSTQLPKLGWSVAFTNTEG